MVAFDAVRDLRPVDQGRVGGGVGDGGEVVGGLPAGGRVAVYERADVRRVEVNTEAWSRLAVAAEAAGKETYATLARRQLQRGDE